MLHDATVDRTTNGNGSGVVDAVRRTPSARRGSRRVSTDVGGDGRGRLGADPAVVKAPEAVPLLAESLKDSAPGGPDARHLVSGGRSSWRVRQLLPSAETGLILPRTPPVDEVIARTREAAAEWALCGIADLTAEMVSILTPMAWRSRPGGSRSGDLCPGRGVGGGRHYDGSFRGGCVP